MAEEKKRKAVYDYEAQMKYRREHQKQMNIRVKTEDYERYVSYAKAHGLAVREFMVLAMEEKMERG